MLIEIVRHGHKADQLPEYDGGPNTPLSDVGHEQASRLGAALAAEEIDAIYSSCQLRALQTAAPVHERTGAPWNVWPVFCESPPMGWRDRKRNDPDGAESLTAWPSGEPIDDDEALDEHEHYYPLCEIPDRFPGAELTQPFPWPDAWWVPNRYGTRETGYARVELGKEAILDRHDVGDHVVIVCHGHSGDMFITSLMDFPRHDGHRQFGFSTTGRARLYYTDDGDWMIVAVDDRSHLPDDLQV